MLDSNLIVYCHEADWCARIKQRGWRIYCVPESQIIHYGGASMKKLVPHWVALGTLHDYLYYFHKHYGAFVRIPSTVNLPTQKWSCFRCMVNSVFTATQI